MLINNKCKAAYIQKVGWHLANIFDQIALLLPKIYRSFQSSLFCPGFCVTPAVVAAAAPSTAALAAAAAAAAYTN